MIRNVYSIVFIFIAGSLFSQEGVRPLGTNFNYIYRSLQPQPSRQVSELSQQKTTSTSFTLPFIEDFYYATTSYYPDPAKWEDSTVFVNTGMPIAPPSIGVATFDGLNKHGYPYNPTLANLSLSFPADVLTSKPINLYTVGQQTLDPFANVALSFYYQARGNGDTPEPADSLILDFYQPLAGTNGEWQKVWYTTGNTNSNINDTVFQRGFVRITDTAYFHDGFRFRFRNYASPTGNFDHWHLDYIFLDQGRGDSLVDTVRNDITFANVPTPFLKDYSAMPFQQYRDFEMASKLATRIKNNSGVKVNLGYKYSVQDMVTQQIVSEYDGGFQNLNPFIPNNETPEGYGYSKEPPHAAPVVQDTFSLSSLTSSEFLIKHYVFLNQTTPGALDVIKENDTVIQYQRFRNYYAFDDGSAEAGYYVNTPGAKIAVKIRLNAPDTLTGMRIYFDPVGQVSSISNTNTSVYGFTINVWPQAGNGGPDLNPIARDSVRNYPFYSSEGFKEIPEYKFKQPIILSPGTYFIGIQQAASTITIGYDRNYNHSSSLYYDAGAGWTQSTEKGSIMMQPVFGTYKPIVGFKNIFLPERDRFLIYPNPSSGQFTIRTSLTGSTETFQLYNTMGQLVKEGTIESTNQQVSTETLNPGMYIVVFKNKGQVVQQQKIILQH